MTEITSVNAPAIGHAGLQRLFAMTREKQMTAEGGSFQAGYEQAKRDFRNALQREVGVHDGYRPDDDKTAIPQITPQEDRARREMQGERRWWHL